MDPRDFLTTVVTASEGWFCLALRLRDGSGWRESWYKWPDDLSKIIETSVGLSSDYDVYFSSYLFSEPQSTKVNVLPSRTLQADLDSAAIDTLPVAPTVLVESSPGRHQGYWILSRALTQETHELLSRKLTYSIANCDRSGWPLGRKLRVVGTTNHKYLEGTHEVKVITCTGRVYEPADLELLPEPALKPETDNVEWLDDEPRPIIIGPYELLESVKGNIPAKAYTQYSVRTQDRSAALWLLECSAFRAGLDRDEVFWLCKSSANNKFDDLRYHQDRELRKDILRAEAFVRQKSTTPRLAILNIRKMTNTSMVERRQQILALVLKSLNGQGDFIRTRDDNIWYVPRDLGRPIWLSNRSDYLSMILNLQFGLNAVETEQNYVIAGMCAYARSLPASADTWSLAHYADGALLLHSGRKEVYRITAESIQRSTDGAYGIVFPWSTSSEPFLLDFEPLGCPWHETVFGDCLDNVIGLTRMQAMALLRAWMLFLLVRNMAVSRPILALFGQPGAGKSTLFRRIYALLYGKGRSIGAVTTPDDFDHAVSNDPLVVLDNVDTWERWLPDRLALCASTSDIIRRKLYTDVDTITLKRNALVGITAHNPKFGREDVTDRLLLITFERLKHFVPEGDIINTIVKYRHRLWGAIVNDIQQVLRTPQPLSGEAPQFRVEDFARIGLWIARALGFEEDFRTAIGDVRGEQRNFSLEQESILIVTLQHLMRKKKHTGEWMTSAQLWMEMEICTPDPLSFTKFYKNSVHLGKKLWSLHDSLKAVFDIEWRFDALKGHREWRICHKQNVNISI